MSNTDRDHGHTDEPTQGENPGAQGDFGAGQGEPGDEESIADADADSDSDSDSDDAPADHTNLAGTDTGRTGDPTVSEGETLEGTEQPRLDDVDGGGAGDEPMDAAGEDEPIAPYDRDLGEDATMINGGNSTR